MGIAIGAVAVVFVLALIIFPGVRGKLKVLVGGFLNIFVEDIAKTPEGAKAVFQQAIEEVQERYNKAGDTLNRFVGEQSSVQKNLNKLYGELKDVESKCESLVRSGNMADAAIFSTRREEILFEISQKEGYLREIEPMVKEAQTVYEAYDKKLRELKKQSRMTVEEMKLRGNMKDLLGDLDELRREELAEAVHLNPDYMARLFKKETGMNLKDYIIQQKMQEAQSLLCTTNLPISLIAAKVGYTNFGHFSTSYKKFYHKTPQEERSAAL